MFAGVTPGGFQGPGTGEVVPIYPLEYIGDGFILSYNVNLLGLSIASNSINIEELFGVEVKFKHTCCVVELSGAYDPL